MSILPSGSDRTTEPSNVKRVGGYLLRCYIDDCDEPATHFVHSYPDDVRLCGRHSVLHPLEAGETECDVDCHICAAAAGGTS